MNMVTERVRGLEQTRVEAGRTGNDFKRQELYPKIEEPQKHMASNSSLSMRAQHEY